MIKNIYALPGFYKLYHTQATMSLFYKTDILTPSIFKTKKHTFLLIKYMLYESYCGIIIVRGRSVFVDSWVTINHKPQTFNKVMNFPAF